VTSASNERSYTPAGALTRSHLPLPAYRILYIDSASHPPFKAAYRYERACASALTNNPARPSAYGSPNRSRDFDNEKCLTLLTYIRIAGCCGIQKIHCTIQKLKIRIRCDACLLHQLVRTTERIGRAVAHQSANCVCPNVRTNSRECPCVFALFTVM
jgi:hypothetical protein